MWFWYSLLYFCQATFVSSWEDNNPQVSGTKYRQLVRGHLVISYACVCYFFTSKVNEVFFGHNASIKLLHAPPLHHTNHTHTHTLHQQYHGLFTDPDFPPTDSSLFGAHGSLPVEWRGYEYHWLRPAKIVDPSSNSKTKWTVFRNPGPEDTAQGVLNNCWWVVSASD